MKKICTSTEESEKLIKLGIDISTADMYWDYDYDQQEYKYYPRVMDERFDDTCIPAWSLAALLELMPRIEHLKPFIDLGPNLDSEVVSIYYHSEDSPYIVKDNLIDAAFEMVVWLKENGKL